jgi:ferrous iron transport protein A
MYLNSLHKGERGEIIKVHADRALRDRFSSFGLMRGEEIVVKACSLARQTMEIEVGATAIALRADEAEKIEVKKLSSSPLPK